MDGASKAGDGTDCPSLSRALDAERISGTRYRMGFDLEDGLHGLVVAGQHALTGRPLGGDGGLHPRQRLVENAVDDRVGGGPGGAAGWCARYHVPAAAAHGSVR